MVIGLEVLVALRGWFDGISGDESILAMNISNGEVVDERREKESRGVIVVGCSQSQADVDAAFERVIGGSMDGRHFERNGQFV